MNYKVYKHNRIWFQTVCQNFGMISHAQTLLHVETE